MCVCVCVYGLIKQLVAGRWPEQLVFAVMHLYNQFFCLFLLIPFWIFFFDFGVSEMGDNASIFQPFMLL